MKKFLPLPFAPSRQKSKVPTYCIIVVVMAYPLFCFWIKKNQGSGIHDNHALPRLMVHVSSRCSVHCLNTALLNCGAMTPMGVASPHLWGRPQPCKLWPAAVPHHQWWPAQPSYSSSLPSPIVSPPSFSAARPWGCCCCSSLSSSSDKLWNGIQFSPTHLRLVCRVQEPASMPACLGSTFSLPPHLPLLSALMLPLCCATAILLSRTAHALQAEVLRLNPWPL